MTVPELKALSRDRGLRNYSQMRKAELVALLQNNGHSPGQSHTSAAPTLCTRPPPLHHRGAQRMLLLNLMIMGVAGFTAFLMMGPPGLGPLWGPMGMGGQLPMTSMWLCPGRWLPGMAKL